jgi:hypothetical protein
MDRRIGGGGADLLAAATWPRGWLAVIELPLPGKWAGRRAATCPGLAGWAGTAAERSPAVDRAG